MSGRTEIERALDGFLSEGPETVNDQALMRTFEAIDRTPQRRDLFAPWRSSLMSINSRLAAVMLVAVIAIGGGAFLLGQRSAVATSSPAPIVTPSAPNPTPSPAAATPTAAPVAIDTSRWLPYTSAFYGFTASHPSGWSVAPGSGHWSLAAQGEGPVDIFWSPSGWPDFMGYESKIPAGMTADEFIEAHTTDAFSSACYSSSNRFPEVTIDGHAANVAYGGCNEHFYFAEATVVVGNRVWFFDLHGPDRSLIVPFLSTVKLDPAAVVD